MEEQQTTEIEKVDILRNNQKNFLEALDETLVLIKSEMIQNKAQTQLMILTLDLFEFYTQASKGMLLSDMKKLESFSKEPFIAEKLHELIEDFKYILYSFDEKLNDFLICFGFEDELEEFKKILSNESNE